MCIDDIKELILSGESEILEFKRSTGTLKSAFKTLCAFLNGQGGTVLIGIKDNGGLIGQDVTDSTNLEISNCVQKLDPSTHISIEFIDLSDNKKIIKLAVEENKSLAPYTFDGKAYWRIASSTRIMPKQQYHQLLLDQSNRLDPWDTQVAKNLDITKLDIKKIISVINQSINSGRLKASLSTNDPAQALQILGLLKNGKITNAAGVLFCKDSEKDFSQSLLKLVHFKGISKIEILDSKRVYGNCFELLEEAEAFVMRHISVRSEFKSGKMIRDDYPDYSLRAIREAIVNAISHRDYSIHGGSISIMMYADRIEISSHGVLPRGITIGELKNIHESFPRNAKLTNVLYKLGIIESVGTGTQEIISECIAIGSPEPQYLERGTTFVVQIFKSERSQKKITASDLTPRQREILEIMLRLESCRSKQIIDSLNNPPTDRTLRNDLNDMKSKGYVEKTGDGSATIWSIKRY